MNILVEVESGDEALESNLMEAPKKLDRKTTLPGNVVLMKVHRSRAIEGKHIFVLIFGDDVAPDLLANWLHQKIKDRATKLFLDRKEVQMEKTEIEIFISEKIAENNPGSS